MIDWALSIIGKLPSEVDDAPIRLNGILLQHPFITFQVQTSIDLWTFFLFLVRISLSG